jgi:hypothetical protein
VLKKNHLEKAGNWYPIDQKIGLDFFFEIHSLHGYSEMPRPLSLEKKNKKNKTKNKKQAT